GQEQFALGLRRLGVDDGGVPPDRRAEGGEAGEGRRAGARLQHELAGHGVAHQNGARRVGAMLDRQRQDIIDQSAQQAGAARGRRAAARVGARREGEGPHTLGAGGQGHADHHHRPHARLLGAAGQAARALGGGGEIGLALQHAQQGPALRRGLALGRAQPQGQAGRVALGGEAQGAATAGQGRRAGRKDARGGIHGFTLAHLGPEMYCDAVAEWSVLLASLEPVASKAASGATPGATPDAIAAYGRDVRLRFLAIGGLAALALCSLLLDVVTGPSSMSPLTVLQGVFDPSSLSTAQQAIVWQVRLPYALMAMMVGAALALAGAEMQTVLNNPLASPFTLGVSSAASFGASLAIVLGVGASFIGADWLVPLNAFVFAFG